MNTELSQRLFAAAGPPLTEDSGHDGHAPGFAAANEKLLAEIVWPHFWAIQILLSVLILAYCVMSELARVLGPDKMKAIFFGPLPMRPILP
ncbi:MAG: hypothetical protein ACREI8_03605 [Myxococcota bacterium]